MSDNSTSGGIGFSSLLQLTFIILKLCKVISWSWWWVLSPTWIGIALVMLICIVFGIIAGYAKWKEKEIRQKRQKTIDDLHSQIEDFRNSWPKVENESPKSKWQQRLDEIKQKRKA